MIDRHHHLRAAVLGLAFVGMLAWPLGATPVPVPIDETTTVLVEEVQRLRAELEQVRGQLAEAQLRAQDSNRELTELRRFIADHDEFGDDFARYRAFKTQHERETRRRAADEQRALREARRAERQARLEETRRERAEAKAAAEWADRYRRAGFASIGLEVFGSRMAYSYETRETNPVRIDYDPIVGLYYRPGGPTTEIDFSAMTISGSVLNASDEVRNIGIAITFFDESSNQVGGEIIRINNARPDVPYPFTSKLEMALDRPFSSSSTYVLYADPIAP